MLRKTIITTKIIFFFLYNNILTVNIDQTEYVKNSIEQLMNSNYRVKRSIEQSRTPPLANYLMSLNPLNILKYHYSHDGFVPLKEYDFIVIGAGASGSVIASRLSENPDWTVLLLEAGSEESLLTDIPLAAFVTMYSEYDWHYPGIKETGLCKANEGEECDIKRGKSIGGSTIINNLGYMRGTRKDYDDIAAAGNPGWAYDDILHYYLKFERNNLDGYKNVPSGNKSGLLSIEHLQYRSPVGTQFLKAGKELGYDVGDYNTGNSLKFGTAQMTAENGRRHSASKAFLYPFRNRTNLHISPYSYVTNINIDPVTKIAESVNYVRFQNHEVFAKKEIILSAGALISPQLLMLSGIGPSEHLQEIGINVIKDLKVGYNLRDHVLYHTNFFVYQDNSTEHLKRFFNDLSVKSFLNYLKDGSGIFASGGTQAYGFMKTNDSMSYHNVEIMCSLDIPVVIIRSIGASSGNMMEIVMDAIKRVNEDKRVGFAFQILLPYPKSVGSLRLENKNPYRFPRIDLPVHEDDIETMKDGIKLSIKISETNAMKKINVKNLKNLVPWCKDHIFGSDDYWRCAIKYTATYGLHTIGTCKMGPASDPTAVVDHRLKVHGIEKLRVGDLSIIPTPFSPHTMAAAFLIGEKLADMIKQDWEI